MAANPSADAHSTSEENARVEAERSGRPFLLFRDGDGRQQLFVFASGSSSASVGRRPSSDLVLDWDDQISRLHARFELVDDAWVLVDDGFSSNGTFVNHERLNGRRRLNDGDTLRFGRTTATFRAPERAQSPAGGVADAPAAVELSTTQRRVLVALCRPCKGAIGPASPATDQQVAEELFLSVGEISAHLRVLYAKLDIAGPSEAEMRVGLVNRAFSAGLISERDL
ncbi:MAG TPA: FHA domain-containing protein [Solirubrobacteraceae bacterium]